MIEAHGKILKTIYGFSQTKKNVFVGTINRTIGKTIKIDYKISVDLNPIQDGMLPHVKELEGKIPNSLEYHKYTANNYFCFGIGPYNHLIFRTIEKNFQIFMEKYVIGYLMAAKHKEITGEWGAGEFSHDSNIALKQSFTRLFGVFDFTREGLERFRENIISNSGICYCGSGKEYNYCHQNRNRGILKEIDSMLIKYYIQVLLKLVNEET